jgi:hypothetical protein
MPKRLLLMLAILFPPSLRAQVAAVQGWCDQGASQALVSGLKSTNYQLGNIPRCTVTPYLTGTTTLATYSLTPTGSPQTGPFTATTIGQWLFFASTSNTYDVVLSGGIPPNTYVTPVTLTGLGANGGGGGGSLPSPAIPNGVVSVNPGATGTTPARTSACGSTLPTLSAQ